MNERRFIIRLLAAGLLINGILLALGLTISFEGQRIWYWPLLYSPALVVCCIALWRSSMRVRTAGLLLAYVIYGVEVATAQRWDLCFAPTTLWTEFKADFWQVGFPILVAAMLATALDTLIHRLLRNPTARLG